MHATLYWYVQEPVGVELTDEQHEQGAESKSLLDRIKELQADRFGRGAPSTECNQGGNSADAAPTDPTPEASCLCGCAGPYVKPGTSAWFKQHTHTPVYEGCQLTSLELSFLLTTWRKQHNVSREAYESLLKLIGLALPATRFFPGTLALQRAVIGVEDWTKYEVHVCANPKCKGGGCRLACRLAQQLPHLATRIEHGKHRFCLIIQPAQRSAYSCCCHGMLLQQVTSSLTSLVRSGSSTWRTSVQCARHHGSVSAQSQASQ